MLSNLETSESNCRKWILILGIILSRTDYVLTPHFLDMFSEFLLAYQTKITVKYKQV